MADYTVYGNLQITKDDIAIRRLESINAKNDMMTAYLGNSSQWRRHYTRFRTHFNGLYDASLYFLSRSKKADISETELKHIRDILHTNGTPENPTRIERAFDDFLAALGRSGLVDFGYEEASYKDKMRQRT